jgi:DNA-binding transcriptional LysR family regulator
MEVRQLEIFCVLANELNFTRTAERVHTVQSNVTTQIKALEQELGVQLFDRLAKHVVLTDAGRNFLPYATRALAAMEEGRQVLSAGSEPAGTLRIGSPESVLTYRLPPVLDRFRRRFPKVEIQFRPQPPGPCGDALEIGQLDMAISMGETVRTDQVRSVRLRGEKVLLFAHPGHPLMAKKVLQPADLTGQVLLLTECGCGYRKNLDQAIASLSIKPESTTEFTSVEAIKQCVMAGMGIGLLPEIVLMRELSAGLIAAFEWDGPDLDIATHILWHRDKWVSPAMKAFLETLEETLQEKPMHEKRIQEKQIHEKRIEKRSEVGSVSRLSGKNGSRGRTDESAVV